MDIKILSRDKINIDKWDQCIDKSICPLVYAKSWYLDIICTNWEGLILNDYEAVMPIPVRDKYRIRYVYQPIFAQQLGLFCRTELSKDEEREIFEFLKGQYRYIDYSLNVNNTYDDKKIVSRINRNFELSLNASYEKLLSNYSKSNRKNLNRAKNHGVEISITDDVTQMVGIVKELYMNKRIVGVVYEDYDNLKGILDHSLENKIGELYQAKVGGELAAMAFFLTTNNKTSIITATNNLGKGTSAMFCLIDHYIQNNSETGRILDFAGSNIKGIADRNKGFGAIEKTYVSIKSNRLPFPLRWIKK